MMNKEIKKDLTDEMKERLLIDVKPILMNKIFALVKKEKVEKECKDYIEATKAINLYKDNFKIIDDDYLKISLHKTTCLIADKDFAAAEVEIEFLKQNQNNFSKEKFYAVDEYEQKIKKLSNSSKIHFKSLFKKDKNDNNINNDNEGFDFEFSWGPVTKEIDESFESLFLKKDSLFHELI